MLTQERLKELLHYNPDTGVFIWRISRRGVKQGKIAGSISSDGYLFIGIDCRLYRAHRLAWLYITGEFPRHQIDHINHDRDDNRICNLRDVSMGENSRNRRKDPRNTSGHTGVYWLKAKKKWQASIKNRGKHYHFGWFCDIEDAKAASKKAVK